MITFSHLGGLGRLGNQLFQYAALRGLGLKNNYETKIPAPNSRLWHGQSCLLDNFNISSDYYDPASLSMIKQRYIEPNHMEYDESFFSIPDNTDLYGFFQSTLYFRDFEQQIKQELTPQAEWFAKADERLDLIKNEHADHKIVSLHLRRGDNTDGSNPSIELNEMYGKDNTLDMHSFYGKYLSAAKDCFATQKVKSLVFSGGSRKSGNDNETDIEWCQRNLIGEEYIFAKPNDTMSDFATIMCCDGNIISHISSFGWWAAYLNKNTEKTVVAPNHYHTDQPAYTHRRGFYPNTWRIV